MGGFKGREGVGQEIIDKRKVYFQQGHLPFLEGPGSVAQMTLLVLIR